MRYILTTLCISCFTIFAQQIEISPDYDKNKKKSKYADWATFNMKAFEVELNDSPYNFVSGSDYKTWEIKQGVDPIGGIKFVEMDGGTLKWEFDILGIPYSASFYGYNDPRMFKIKSPDKTYYMVSHEPDCNSIFNLYSTSKDEYEYDPAKSLISGEAKKACDKTDWVFDIQKKKLDNEIILVYMFSAMAANNVRYFQW